LLRDLKGLYDFEPAQQQWAREMAGLLIEARDAASAARLAGQPVLDAAVLDDLVTRYRALATAGLAANLYRRTATASDARRLARRFRGFEDMILRFATRPDLDIFSNNEAVMQSVGVSAQVGVSSRTGRADNDCLTAGAHGRTAEPAIVRRSRPNRKSRSCMKMASVAG
jgi:hypothetical protein